MCTFQCCIVQIRPSHEEMSVKYKGWLSQGAVIRMRKPKGGDGWQWRFGKNEICSSGILCSRVPNHVYQWIWNPFVGEVAIAVREERNTHDRYAVAILEEDTCCSVGHLPCEISKECFYFLKMDGAIKLKLLGHADGVTYPRVGLRSHAF